MAFAIKAEVRDPRAKTFAFAAQKTMYGGKRIAKGDTIFVFASENDGGHGLWRRPTNTAREHHRETHRAFEAAVGAGRAQAFRRAG